MKSQLFFLLTTVYYLLFTSPAFAHKVNIFAYVEGDTVYTESYFPDGRKVEGSIIEVYDSQGNKLLEGKTNKQGQFNFKPPKNDDLKIVLIASMGHKNSYTLSKDELPQILAGQRPQKPKPKESKAKEVSQVDLNQIKRIIDTSLDKKLKPIMREIAKTQQRKVSFREVIGGIGYIFGIMGIIAYFLVKNKDNHKKNASTRD